MFQFPNGNSEWNSLYLKRSFLETRKFGTCGSHKKGGFWDLPKVNNRKVSLIAYLTLSIIL